MDPDRVGLAMPDSGRVDLRHQAPFEWAATGMTVISLEGRYLSPNPALCRMLGYSADELLEIDVRRITHPEDRAVSERLHRQLVAGERPSFVLEQRYLAKGGRVVWGRLSAAMIRDHDGIPLHVAATVEDLTDHKLAAEQLDLSQSLLRIAGRKARVGGWAIAQPSQELFWSDEIFDLLDAPAGEEPPLTGVYALYPPEDRERLEAAVDACAREGTPFDLELEMTTFAGRMLGVRVVGEAERAEDGTITRVTGAFQDISELKAAHAETEEIAERLATSLESMTDAVCLLDWEGRFTYLNPRAEELLCHGRQEFLGRSIGEMFPEVVDHPMYPALHRAVRHGQTLVFDELYFPPLDKWFMSNIYPSSQGPAVYFRDVSEQHAARVALEQREAQVAEQAALLDETQEAVFVQDLEGIVTFWNRSAERIYGSPSDQAIGRRAHDLVAGDAALHAAARHAVVTEGVWNRELRYVTRDGRDLIVEARWTVLRDAAGSPRSILVTDTDVTADRCRERQVIRSQRIESLGTLAGGIAHDLNNALAPIFLAVELLSGEESDERKLDMLSMIQGSAQRGAAMVRQVLSFARGVEGGPVDLDVTQVFGDVLRIAAETFPRDIEFSIEFSPTVGRVRGDETQLHQVLMNLLLNARDAMPQGGGIRCSAFAAESDRRAAPETRNIEPGHYVVLQVEDDGSGIPSEVIDRVFEPFFTTKQQGEGTGLGLSTSLAIVEGHGGDIRVDSTPGSGSTFRVYLPTPGARGSSTAYEPVVRPAPGSGEWVLLVDDESQLLSMMQRTLQRNGYRVLTAVDGAEAIALYRLRGDDIALVITDLMMPVMGGSAAIEAIRRMDPAVRVIASSGLAEQPRDNHRHAEVAHVLAKPFTTEQLLRAVAAALAEDP